MCAQYVFDTMAKIFYFFDVLAALLLFAACVSPQGLSAQRLQAYHNKDEGGYHFWLYTPAEKVDTMVLRPKERAVKRPFHALEARTIPSLNSLPG